MNATSGAPISWSVVARLKREQDNVRAALGWTLTSDGDPDHGLRIAAAMVRFWDVHGDLREGVRWLSDLLTLRTVRPSTLGWARAVTARAYLTILSGDGASGMALLDETLPFWRALGDPRGLAMALFFRGLAIAWTATDIQRSRSDLRRKSGPRPTAWAALDRVLLPVLPGRGRTPRGRPGASGRSAERVPVALVGRT